MITPGHVVSTSLTTYVAFVWLGFLRGFAFMIFQKVKRGILFFTHTTFILLRFTMGRIMSLQIALLEKTPTANFTPVGFVAAVSQSVSAKGTDMRQSSTTQITLIGFSCLMALSVFNQFLLI